MNDSSRRWRAIAVRFFAVIAVIICAAAQSDDSVAQQSSGGVSDILNNIDPTQMMQLFTGQGRSGPLSQSPGTQAQTTILEPTATQNSPLPRSRLEQIMSTRAGVVLYQFGYDQLGIGREVSLPQVGGVQDNYVLGAGDEIVVSLRGQENAEYRVQVDRDGTVVLPKLKPIEAAGRTWGDFRQDLDSNIRRAFVSTQGFATLSRLRQISVIVAGEVGSPGVRILTGLSSPIDAILVSGGIRKTGSLRQVRLISRGRTTNIDLYGYLTNGAVAKQTPLADGDRIVVPPLGKTIAAAGWVRRPGIYEMAPGQSSMSVRQLTELAGGTEVRGRYRVELMHVEASGQTQLEPVTAEAEPARDSDILLILPEANQIVDRATLSGGVPLAGGYAIRPGMHLSELLKAPGALGASPYTVFGIISRKDPRTYLRSLVAFSPIAALNGDDDPVLQSDDVIRIFSMRESRLLSESLSRFAQIKRYNEEVARDPYAELQPTGGDQSTASRVANASGQANGANSQGSGGGQPGSNNPFPPYATASSGEQQPCDQLTPYGQSSPGGQPSPSGQSPGEISPATQSPLGTSALSDQSAALGLQSQLLASNPQAIQSALAANPELAARAGAALAQTSPTANGPQGSGAMGSRGSASNCLPTANLEHDLPTYGIYPANAEARTIGEIASQLDVDVTVLLNFLEDHEVTLDGAVRGPGTYVVGPSINLHDVVMVAGGTVHWADQSGVELISTTVDEAAGRSATTRRTLALNSTSLSNYVVKPHDELRFHEVFTDVGVGSATLEGEVRFPGRYKIIRGERLTDLLQRAGGLTNVAYPYGTVYLRHSVAALEEESFRRTAETIENELVVAMAHGSVGSQTKLDPSSFAALQIFINQLRNQKGLGRISISADPTYLASKKEQDLLIESGDVIYIPQRPSTVSVLGAVLQPGSFAYQPGLTADDYLKKSGGFTEFSDDSLTYIVLPNGAAEKLDRAWLPFGSTPIPAGSVIVVPRDVAPILWTDVLQYSSQIFSQLAIAGASLAVISHP